jgi:hypothetical protein
MVQKVVLKLVLSSMLFAGAGACAGAAAAAGAHAQVKGLQDYPVLPARAGDANGFVPAGWKLEVRQDGDLNGDGVPDLLLVLQQDDPAKILQTPAGQMGADSVNANPRILAVAFADARPAKGYTLALQDHSLIPIHDNPVLEDPLDDTGGIAIKKGTFQLSLHYFASAGSWEMSNTTYTFRYQDGAFKLIGYDENEVNRGSGKLDETSINFLTGKKKLSSGTIENDKMDVTWKNLGKRPLLNLDQVAAGLEAAVK